MSGGFRASPDAIRAQAQVFFGESDNLAQLVGKLGGIGKVSTGDGGLDGLIAYLIEEIVASAGGAGMTLAATGGGLVANARRYEEADAASQFRFPGG